MPHSSFVRCAQLVNDAVQDYRWFVATTTGHFAFEDSNGALYVCPVDIPQVIPASQAIALWSCAGPSDPRPVGNLTASPHHQPDTYQTLNPCIGIVSIPL